MNEKLNCIYRQPTDMPLRVDEICALFTYFKLCGEEYFYFQEDFIHPRVWQAWENGMKFFRQNPRIKKLRDEDLKSDTYYGLNFEDDDETKSKS